ncbi:hypothetical protein B0H11DRAFT_1966840 [Mycena galericulata]|nr:hypothetical protein B0H11DRAFT_1966840 [Mycena galericulata]
MHPAVNIKSFKSLPPSIRRVAEAACTHNCPLEHVERARDFLMRRDVPHSQQLAFLPVLFCNLDPAGIPTGEALKVLDRCTRDTVSRASVSLDGLSCIFPPVAAGVSLWPRVWPWIDFMDTNWDHLSGVSLRPKFNFYFDFIKFCGWFHKHPETSELMSGTAGFRVLIARTWRFLPAIPEPRRELLIGDLGTLIAHSSLRDPHNLSELLEGAGGTVDGLASLVVDYLRAVAERTLPLTPSSTAIDVLRILYFVKAVDLPPAGTEWIAEPLGPLSQRLIFHHVAPALVTVMLTLTRIVITTGRVTRGGSRVRVTAGTGTGRLCPTRLDPYDPWPTRAFCRSRRCTRLVV